MEDDPTKFPVAGCDVTGEGRGGGVGSCVYPLPGVRASDGEFKGASRESHCRRKGLPALPLPLLLLLLGSWLEGVA